MLARLLRTLAIAVLAVTAMLPGGSPADEQDAMHEHCDRLRTAPAPLRSAFERLDTELRANEPDDREQGRHIAAAARTIIDAPPGAVDAACRTSVAHIAALADFVGGDAPAAVRDERTAIAGGVALHGSAADRSQVYVLFAAYLHATGDVAGAIAAERQAMALTAGSRDPEALTNRSQAQLALAGFLGESAAYAASVTTYEAVADDAGAAPLQRMWGALFGGWLRQAMGRDAESARDFERALSFAPTPEAAELVAFYHGMAALAAQRYGDAEALEGEMQRRILPAQPDAAFMGGLAESLLGSVYLAENRVADAAAAYDRSRAELERVQGTQSASALVAVLSAEADMYVRLGRYAEARAVLADAIPRSGSANPLVTMIFGGAGPLVVPLYALDGAAALALGDLRAAGDDVSHELAALRASPRTLAEAGALAGRAAIERLGGDLAAARRDIDDARALAARLAAAQAAPALDLQSGVIAYYAGDVPTAKRDFGAAFSAAKRLYGGVFGVLGERDRLGFVQLYQPLEDAYLTFAVRDARRDPSLGGDAYDLALFRKGLVAQTVAALEARVRQSHDLAVARTFAALVATRKQLATSATVSVSSDARTQAVDALTRQAQDLERTLLARFPDLAATAPAGARWQDVRAALRPGEASVELLRYRRIADRRTDGPPFYAAAVLRPGAAGPLLVDLGPAAAIEGAALLAYRQIGVPPAQRLLPPDRHALEKLVWAPLVPALGGARTVYLAADGVLDTVAFDVLQDDAGRALGDAVDVRLVDSTKDLLAASRPTATATAKTALLFGDPAFDLSVAQQQAAVHGVSAAQPDTTFAALRAVADRAPLPPLPGTGVEVTAVERLLREHGWTTQRFVGAAALQETLEREAHGQRVVHLATHGTFLADPESARPEVPFPDVALQAPNVQQDRTAAAPPLELPESVIGTPDNDPMLRSMLFFAGADRAWAQREAPPPGLESGILTAADAASLDLHGTELVVLSACETGLGAVRSGDGVLGLRRALREAGAQAVLMSLWRLPDRETSELMTAFYAHWLAGEEAHAALRAAEREERSVVARRYGTDDVYYWGGFVVVGVT